MSAPTESTRVAAGRTLTPAEAASAGPWDLVVIGSGSAGLVASRGAGRLGARVLLVERHLLGGECLHTGCVPSKALIAAAHAAHAARTGARFGVTATDVSVDFDAVMRHVRAAIARIVPADSAEAIGRDGVSVLFGEARFAGPGVLEVEGNRIRYADAVIATGSTPVVPEIDGIDDVEVLTNDTVFDLSSRPERLLVLGGGAIGCELGQAMARLGSAVSLVHRGPRLLPKEDERASALVWTALEADGVDMRTGVTVVRIVASPARGGGEDGIRTGGIAHLSDGSTISFDRLLAALGRRVDTSSLGLAAVHVETDAAGAVVVDAAMRTTAPRIWAAGDVTPLPRFTHTAGMYGSVAGTNAVLGLRRRADTDTVPRVTFTHPEVGAVGVASADAARRGLRVVTWEHSHTDRAIAEDDTDGYTSIVVDGRGRVRGASVVGPRAGETLGELSVAVKLGLTATQLATTMHAYPTYNDAAWNAVVEIAQDRLRAGAVGWAVGALRGLRARRARGSAASARSDRSNRA